MQRITLQATCAEFYDHLQWAKDSGVQLSWMGVDIDAALEIMAVEAETEDRGIAMPYNLDMEEDHAVLCMVKWGVKPEKASVLHMLPPEGASIYERLQQVQQGLVSSAAPRFEASWVSWKDEYRIRINDCVDSEEFKMIYFGQDGIVEGEIAAFQKLIDDGYHFSGVDGDAVSTRWGSPQLGIEVLKELLG